jgi:hypothetical protein
MSLVVRGRSVARSAGATSLVGLILLTVLACEPSAPPGFTQSAAPGGPATGAPAGSAAGPSAVAGKPTVTMDGTTVMAAGLGAGKTPDFDLPAGKAEMVVTPCASNKVNPFVTLFDAKDNKLAIVVDPTYTISNLAGGSYYLDVAANPGGVWGVEIKPG